MEHLTDSCTACITLDTAVLAEPLLVQEAGGQAVAWYQCRECGHIWWTSWNLAALAAMGAGGAA